MARPPISLVENQNPQIDQEELMAEVEIEAPGTLQMPAESDFDIEIDDDTDVDDVVLPFDSSQGEGDQSLRLRVLKQLEDTQDDSPLSPSWV